MIPVLLTLALLGWLRPEIGLAIPSPDFMGPLLTWVVTILGFLAAGIGVLGAWLKTLTRSIQNLGERRMIWLLFFLLVCFAVGLVGSFGYIRYLSFRPTQQLGTVFPPTHTTSTEGSTDLLSQRVSTSTVLVPTSLLKEVVTERHWDQRILLLDIREQEEREVGFVDASTTWIRLGDLMNGGYRSLPADKDILVICWNSMRGEETARWLREHGFARSFGILGGLQGVLNEGGHGWIPDGLPWTGLREANDIVSVFEHGRVLALKDAKRWNQEGAQVIDMRDEAAFADGHIPGALHLHLQTSTSERVALIIRGLEKHRSVLLYSDDQHSDFYAEALELRLRRMGYLQVGLVRDAGHEWGY